MAQGVPLKNLNTRVRDRIQRGIQRPCFFFFNRGIKNRSPTNDHTCKSLVCLRLDGFTTSATKSVCFLFSGDESTTRRRMACFFFWCFKSKPCWNSPAEFRIQYDSYKGSKSIFVSWCFSIFQWEFQDPKMEVLYHIRPYFVGIFPYIGLI